MLLRPLLPIALLVAGAQAVIIPEGLPDGVWSIAFDPSSDKIINEPALIRYITAHDIAFASVEDDAILAARQNSPPPLENPRPTCGNQDLNRNDYTAAKGQLQGICESDRQYEPNLAVVVTVGNTMAYMCNFGARNRCWRQEYEEFSSIIDRQCGQNRVGTVYVQRWDKSYGRDNRGANICVK